MYTSKVYTILTYFDVYEQNRLRKYINSPYFNKNETLKDLFELLLDISNKYKGIDENGIDEKFPNKEEVWTLLKPDRPYDYTRFRKYCSDLLKLIEGFLAQQVFEENPLYQATYLIEAIGNRKMEKLYNSSMKSARLLSKKQLYKPSSYYFYQYQIERNYFDLTQKEHKRRARQNVEEIVTNLDRFYLAEKLKYYCLVLTQQYVVSQNYEVLFIDEIINHIKSYNYDDIPPITVYYHLLLIIKEPQDKLAYDNLIKLINSYSDIFPKSELEHLFTTALNFCIYNINTGNQEFLKEYLFVYDQILKNNLIADEISPWVFKNTVVIALRLKKFDWVENYINTYQYKLPETFRENAVHYNLSQLFFYKKDYNKVIELLQNVEYEDPAYNLGAKTMLMAIYYETDEIEPLYSLFDSFRVFLNRNKKISQKHKKLCLNLIKFVKKLTRINRRDKKEIEQLKLDVENSGGVASDTWLREKIAELEGAR